MKEFWVYTLLRLALFLGSFAIVGGLWLAIAGEMPALPAVIIAFLISGVGSYFLLDRPRQALAVRVERRAGAMSSKLEEMRSKEDQD